MANWARYGGADVTNFIGRGRGRAGFSRRCVRGSEKYGTLFGYAQLTFTF